MTATTEVGRRPLLRSMLDAAVAAAQPALYVQDAHPVPAAAGLGAAEGKSFSSAECVDCLAK